MNWIPYTGDRSAMEGYRVAGEGIASGIKMAGSAIAGGIGKMQENSMKADYLSGKADQLHEAGVMTKEDLDKFKTGSLGQKEGILTGAMMKYEVLEDTRRRAEMASRREAPWTQSVTLPDGTQAVMSRNGGVLGRYMADGSPISETTQLPKVGAAFPIDGGGGRMIHEGGGKMRFLADENTPQVPDRAGSMIDLGNGFKAFWNSDKSASLVPPEKSAQINVQQIPADGGSVVVMTGPDGKAKMDFVKEDAATAMIKAEGKRAQDADREKLAEFQTELKRGNKFGGPDFLKMGTDYEMESNKLKAKIGTPSATSSNRDSVLNEARKAIQSGANPEKVKERLKQMGIDPNGI